MREISKRTARKSAKAARANGSNIGRSEAYLAEVKLTSQE